VTIELNHTIVPGHDKEASARFYERILGFPYQGPLGHFAPVRIPSQAMTLDFDNRESFEPQHYTIKVGETEFDEIFVRVKAEGLAYGSEPWTRKSEDQPLERRARRLLSRSGRASAGVADQKLHGRAVHGRLASLSDPSGFARWHVRQVRSPGYAS
jgi:catechol 2,3-dioxygenase-like lactoylglutathione lyase family enzyme